MKLVLKPKSNATIWKIGLKRANILLKIKYWNLKNLEFVSAKHSLIKQVPKFCLPPSKLQVITLKESCHWYFSQQ